MQHESSFYVERIPCCKEGLKIVLGINVAGENSFQELRPAALCHF